MEAKIFLNKFQCPLIQEIRILLTVQFNFRIQSIMKISENLLIL